MSTSSRFPTYHVPDDGTRYAPGEHVSVDQSSGRVRIIKDTEGAYEVMGCRSATEYGDTPPLLRIDLRKREVPQSDGIAPWSQERPTRW